MNRREELEQQLWEFVYELLPGEDAASVADLITSDPDAARLYADIKLQQELLAEASQLDMPQISLVPPAADGEGSYEETERDIRVPTSVGRPRSFAANAVQWLVATAAIALVGLLVFSYANPDSPVSRIALQKGEQAIADQPAFATLVGPDRLQSAAGNYFTVMTRSASGKPAAADLSYAVYDTDDRILYRNTTRADSSGLAQLKTPESLAAEEVRLEVALQGKLAVPAVRARLPVEDVQLTTHLTLDKPWYRPGEAVRFRSLTLSRFSLDVLREVDVEFGILSPRGEPLAGAVSCQTTQQGVASGEYAISEQLHGGKYTLFARSPSGAFERAARDFYVREYRTSELVTDLEFLSDSYAPGEEVAADFSAHWSDGRPAGNTSLEAVAIVDGQTLLNLHTVTRPDGTYRVRFTLPKTVGRGEGVLGLKILGESVGTTARAIPIQLDDFRVDFYPESGNLAADLPNRIYFHAHTVQGEPVHVRGRVVDGDGETLLSACTVHEGRGVFRLTPAAGQRYRFEFDSPSGTPAAALPAADSAQDVVINAGTAVFDAGKPAELEVLAKPSDVPRALSVVATCRGVVVGQQTVAGDQRVDLEMDDRAQGVIRLTVYDLNHDPPWPLAERLIYRRPLRFLDVRLADTSESYSPGQAVNLRLAVRDELGRPQPAMLGVSVVDRSLLRAADVKTPRMTTHFWLTAEIADAEDLEDANFYLEPGDEAAEALDLLLGTQGWRRFVKRPRGMLASADFGSDSRDSLPRGALASSAPSADLADTSLPKLLGDNREPAREVVQRAVGSLYAARRVDLHRLGSVLAAGAAVILFALLAAGLFRLLQDPRFWLPSLGAAAICLAVGGVWMSSSDGSVGSVAWLESDTDQPAVRVAQAPQSLITAADKEVRSSGQDPEMAVLDEEFDEEFGEVFDESRAYDHLARSVAEPSEGEEQALEQDMVEASPVVEAELLDQPAFGSTEAGGFPGGMGGMGGGGLGGMGGGGAVDALSLPEPEAAAEVPAAELMEEELKPTPSELADEAPPAFDAYGGANAPVPGQTGSRGVQPKKTDGLAAPRIAPASAMPAPAAAPSMMMDAADDAPQDFARQRPDAMPKRRTAAARAAMVDPAKPDSQVDAERHVAADSRDRGDRDMEKDAQGLPVLGLERWQQPETGAKSELPDLPEPLSRETRERDLERGDGDSLPVREYAFRSQAEQGVSIRDYFGDCLFWAPAQQTDETGRAELRFVLADATTTYDVLADAHAAGRIGSGGGTIVSRLPFHLTPATPVELAVGDVVDLPVAVVNGTSRELTVGVELDAGDGLKLAGQALRERVLTADQRATEYFTLTASDCIGPAQLTCRGTAGAYRDAVQRSIRISPGGYPVRHSYAGEVDGKEIVTIVVPAGVDARFLTANVTLFPSPVSQFVKGLESLTKSRTGIPDVEALTYYKAWFARPYTQQNSIADPVVTRQIKRLAGDANVDLLARSDDKLEHEFYYRQSNAGWRYGEGSDGSSQPGTPPSLDDLELTRSSLLGGLSPIEADAFGLWARNESGQPRTSSDAQRVFDAAAKSEDPYLIALASLASDDPDGRKLANRLADLQGPDGSIAVAEGDASRKIESTSLAILALLGHSAADESVREAIRWLNEQRQPDGGFGTPTATALALKAIMDHAQRHAGVVGKGELVLRANGQEVHRQEFTEASAQPIVFRRLSDGIRAGDNELEIVVGPARHVPYVVDIEYRAAEPRDSTSMPLRLETELSKSQVSLGDLISLRVAIEGPSDFHSPVTAVVGLPAGLSPRLEQLDELQAQGRIGAYEIDGRRLMIHGASTTRVEERSPLNLDLIAEFSGRFTGPASCIYGAANPNQVRWCKPLEVEVGR